MDGYPFIHPAIWNLGPTEIVLILIVAVILFGGKLPDVARTFGRSFFEFRKNLRDLQDEIYRQDYNPPKRLPKPYYEDGAKPTQQESGRTPAEAQEKATPEASPSGGTDAPSGKPEEVPETPKEPG